MFLKLNRQSKKLRELCGTTLIGVNWLDELHETRNAKCPEVADHAESLRDPSQRNATSKRTLCAGHDFPELVMLSLQTADGEREFSCPLHARLSAHGRHKAAPSNGNSCRGVHEPIYRTHEKDASASGVGIA